MTCVGRGSCVCRKLAMGVKQSLLLLSMMTVHLERAGMGVRGECRKISDTRLTVAVVLLAEKVASARTDFCISGLLADNVSRKENVPLGSIFILRTS